MEERPFPEAPTGATNQDMYNDVKNAVTDALHNEGADITGDVKSGILGSGTIPVDSCRRS